MNAGPVSRRREPATGTGREHPAVSRRGFLIGAAAGVAGLAVAACTPGSPPAGTPGDADAIAAAEAARPHTGRTVTHTLAPRSVDIDLGGPTVRTLAYGDTVPGIPIRAGVGDELAVTVVNGLDHATSVHWHGIALRNDMDGAAPASPDVAPGRSFTYRFTLPHPGSYWAHPHVGLDTDHGLYLPVVVDDPNDPGDYDAEWIVVLDDWTDGIGPDPHADPRRPARRRHEDGRHGHGARTRRELRPGVGSSALLGGDAGDVGYPHYLVNGRIPTAPTTFTAAPGQRLRIRIVNAAADTAFRVALAEHTHDRHPHRRIPRRPGRGRRAADRDGRTLRRARHRRRRRLPAHRARRGQERARARPAAHRCGPHPDPGYRPRELDGRVATVDTFTAAETVALPPARPDVT